MTLLDAAICPPDLTYNVQERTKSWLCIRIDWSLFSNEHVQLKLHLDWCENRHAAAAAKALNEEAAH